MSENRLAEKKCEPCAQGVAPLKGEAICCLAGQVSREWKVVAEHHIARDFKFKDFAEALKFVNKVGRLAESEGHHPDIYLSWGRASITLYTHKIDGLSRNDFIIAAKIDELQKEG